MKICLINPPIITPQKWGYPAVFQPLGLAYLASVLEQKHDVSILDAPIKGWKNLKLVKNSKYYLGMDLEDIRREIINESPDMVGISVPFTISEKISLEISSIVKSIDENIITIFGGPDPSVRPTNYLSVSNVDFVVIGEGEQTMSKLVQVLESGSKDKVNKINGIAYYNGKTIITPPNAAIKNLDSIPFPARHLLPMNEYFKAAKANMHSRRYVEINSNRWSSMITSRGCPNNCIFCSIHLTMGKRWRARSPENVIDEIEFLVNNYKIRHIYFEDDNMTLNKKRAERIFELIVERNIDIEWSLPNGVRADSLDKNLINKMKKSGCKYVFVAPESGNQEVLNNIIKKKIDLQKIEESVYLFKKSGIVVDGSFVIGFIGETKANILDTRDFAEKLRKLGMRGAGVHFATPYYGTELFNQAKQLGYLKEPFDIALLSPNEPLIETPEFTIEELKVLRNEIIKAGNPPVIVSNLLYAFKHPNKIIQIVKRQIINKLKSLQERDLSELKGDKL